LQYGQLTSSLYILLPHLGQIIFFISLVLKYKTTSGRTIHAPTMFKMNNE